MTHAVIDDVMTLAWTPQSGPVDSEMRAALHEAFGVDFVLWKFGEPSTAEAKSDRTGDLELVERVAEELAEPQIVAREDGCWLLALPLVCQNGHNIIATAEIKTADPELLLKAARQCSRHLEANRNLQELESESDDLVRQIARDMEDLSFLRMMAEKLTLSGRSVEAIQLAELVLPRLRERIQAEGITFVSSGVDDSGEVVGAPVLTVGEIGLDAKTCRSLVDRFRVDAAQAPVIRNHCDESEEFSGAPRLRSFLLVPMQRGQFVFGWLLAVNRDASSSVASEIAAESPWRLSQHEFGSDEAMLLNTSGLIIGTHASNARLIREKDQSLVDVVRALVRSIEAKDRYTFGHSERVAMYAKHIGATLGLKQAICDRIHLAGLLHDVGKIATQDDVLTKPGKLTDEQFDIMRQHPDEGWSILEGLPTLDDILPGVLYHHERWDGNGYPDGLAGEQIPLDSRILAVADAFDAMTSSRPYRDAMPVEKALNILNGGAGSQWDPQVIAAFSEDLPRILRIRNEHVVSMPRKRSRLCGR